VVALNVNRLRLLVQEIKGDEVYYTMFSLNVIFHKKVKDVVWNEGNWRWETRGVGSLRKLERETTPRSVLR
jgi:hypothetical protein